MGRICAYTPLYIAAQKGHSSVVELLLKVDGVDANKENIFGDTPLHIARGRGHNAIVQLLSQ